MDLKAILYGFFIMLMLVMVGFLLVGFTVYFFYLESLTVFKVLMTVNIIALTAGALITGRSAGRSGWLNGGLMGLGYIVFLHVIAVILLGSFSIGYMTLLPAFILGAAGGMVGINLSS